MGKLRRVIGYVGVDSGMMMLGDPCYLIESDFGLMSWSDFLAKHIPENTWPVWPILAKHGQGCLAIVTNTGHGDGMYPVTAEFDAEGRVIKLSVSFK